MQILKNFLTYRFRRTMPVLFGIYIEKWGHVTAFCINHFYTP